MMVELMMRMHTLKETSMKTYFLLVLCMWFIASVSKAQTSKSPKVQGQFSKVDFPFTSFTQLNGRRIPLDKKYDSTGRHLADQVNYIQRSRAHQLNGLVLFASGSIIGVSGIRSSNYGYNILNKYPENNAVNTNERLSATRQTLTGLAMIAGSIPYFISALKNRSKGLKLTSQRTTAGCSNKASKGITSLTFCVPIGK